MRTPPLRPPDFPGARVVIVGGDSLACRLLPAYTIAAVDNARRGVRTARPGSWTAASPSWVPDRTQMRS